MSGAVLVTGGAGFIGSEFVRHAIDEFDMVHVLDKLTYAGNRDNLAAMEEDIEFVEGDIRDREMLSSIYPEVTHIVNFAAETHVDRSISSGQEFVRSNVEGAFAVMDAMRDHDIEKLVHISTDEVYGSTANGVFSEEDSLDPSSPYSASKAGADCMANAMWRTYDLPVSVVRPTNAYGPRQYPEKLIPKFTLRALEGKPLPVYGDGSNVRQWIHVEDLSRAILRVLAEGEQEIYNVAGTEEVANIDVTKAILRETGASEDLIEFVEDRKGHDFRYALDDSKIRSELGFQPEIGFENGLARTVDWYRERRDRFTK